MADWGTAESTEMSFSMWGVVWSEYTFDGARCFIWEEGVGGTVDLC